MAIVWCFNILDNLSYVLCLMLATDGGRDYMDGDMDHDRQAHILCTGA